MGKLKTTLLFYDGRGGELEEQVCVTYEVTPGYAETREEPGCEATVEITEIRDSHGDPVRSYSFECKDLQAECLQDWHDDQIAAAEYAAELRADMMEKF
jgi:hypothetical protein